MTEKLTIDKHAIQQLLEILQESDIDEIEYEQDGRRIRLARQAFVQPPPAMQSLFTPPLQPAEPAQADIKDHPGIMRSPMVGTVYTSPEPGAPAFVHVGDIVTVGQTLMIIEAMKVMNPLKAQKAGKIIQIFAQDAMPVEFGEPLLVIE